MLRQILDAHEGVLPEGCHVVFCNTGLEHPGTLRFVHEVELNWGVPVVWLEYRRPRAFVVVDYDSASRKGEPFEELIAKKSALPNGRMRFCTQELKIFTIKRYAEEHLGLTEWQEVIGLRYDEPRRVARLDQWHGSRDVVAPMFHAKHDKQHVIDYWKVSPFDLDIPAYAGNCVGCFLKGAALTRHIAEQDPSTLEWWAKAEELSGSVFNNHRPTYRDIIKAAGGQLPMFDDSSIPFACTD